MLMLVVVFSSCVKNKNGVMTQNQAPSNGKSFEVVEVVQGNNYTYIRAKEDLNEKWIAVSKQDVQPGTVYFYEEGLPMANFHSKEIDRTFDMIYFVSAISTSPLVKNEGTNGNMGSMGNAGVPESHMGKVNNEKNTSVNLEKKADEVTVAQVYADRNNYSGKEVEIRGVVVKVNKEVMGKNWIHIQDGTENNGNFDLTVTTTGLAEVNDQITVKGKIILNKDFGYGYKYDVIMEDATVVVNKPAGTAM